MFLLLLLLVLAVLAYHTLGTPLLDYIHRFTKEFTSSFPLWTLFGLDPLRRARGGRADKTGRD